LNPSSVKGEHPAVRVVDEDDLLGAEQALGDRQRADLVVGDHAAGVADDVRIALVEPQDAQRVDPGVHAGHDRDLLGRRHRKVALVEGGRVGPRCCAAARRSCPR
jgi:hypothetical protein